MTPTLDALADQPDLARHVPRDTLMRAMMACALALAGDPEPAAAIEQVLSDTLSTREAARLLGIAPRTLTRLSRTTFRALRLETGTRHMAWSRRAISAWQQQQQEDEPPEIPAYPWLKAKRS